MNNELFDNPHISHVGIAVRNLEKSIEQYRLITSSNPFISEVLDQKVRVAIFKSKNSVGGRIELVSPTSDDSPVAKYIEKRGEGLHHICIYVKDIKAKLAELKESGAKLINEIPRVGAEGNLIAFVHPKDFNGVLIELEEINSQ